MELIGEPASWSSASVVITVGFSLKVSVTHSRARRNGDADLAIVAECSWMKREHCITIYVCRNCLFRRRLAFRKRRDREPASDGHSIEFASSHLRGHLCPVPAL